MLFFSQIYDQISDTRTNKLQISNFLRKKICFHVECCHLLDFLQACKLFCTCSADLNSFWLKKCLVVAFQSSSLSWYSFSFFVYYIYNFLLFFFYSANYFSFICGNYAYTWSTKNKRKKSRIENFVFLSASAEWNATDRANDLVKFCNINLSCVSSKSTFKFINEKRFPEIRK